MRSLAPLFLLLAIAGCDSKPATPPATPTPPPPPTGARVVPTPVDPMKLPAAYRADAATIPLNVASSLAFIQMMLDEQKSTMDQVTCHCCGKTLAQCYLDTAIKAAKACSPL